MNMASAINEYNEHVRRESLQLGDRIIIYCILTLHMNCIVLIKDLFWDCISSICLVGFS